MMKRILQIKANENYTQILLLIVRLSVAGLMITHGLPKLNKLLAGGEILFADPIGLGATLTLILVVFSEFFCSVLIGIGLATRLAAIPLIITMLVAAFVTHGADPIGKKELALLYLIIYGVLLVAGSGKYSVDHLLMRNKEGGA
jgi:putative oxidoreductase